MSICTLQDAVLQNLGVAISKSKRPATKVLAGKQSKVVAELAALTLRKPASFIRSLTLAVEFIGVADDPEAILAVARQVVVSATSVKKAVAAIKLLSAKSRKRPARTGRGGPTSSLTPAQRRVYALLLEGLIEREVAVRLGISPHTVHNHVTEIYRKLAVSTRGELVSRWAKEKGVRIEEEAQRAASGT